MRISKTPFLKLNRKVFSTSDMTKWTTSATRSATSASLSSTSATIGTTSASHSATSASLGVSSKCLPVPLRRSVASQQPVQKVQSLSCCAAHSQALSLHKPLTMIHPPSLTGNNNSCIAANPVYFSPLASASHSIHRTRTPTRAQAYNKDTSDHTRFENETRPAGGGGGYELLKDVDRITSISNRYVKHCVQLLKSTSYRKQQGTCVLVGRTILEEVVESCGGDLRVKVLILPDYKKIDQSEFVGVRADRVVSVSEPVLKKIAGVKNVDRLEVVVEIDRELEIHPTLQINRLLALDGVQDPGNLGTLVRSALAFGWDAVAVLPSSVDPLGDKALRSSRGAIFRLPIQNMTWEALSHMAHSRRLKLIAADPAADPEALNQISACLQSTHNHQGEGEEGDTFGVCLVLGSEGQGLSKEALQACTPVSIPMSGQMESLNVGVAGGILMYLLRKE